MIFMNENFEVIPYASYTYEGVTHSRNIFRLWSRKQLSEVGVYEVSYAEVPEGKIAVDWTYKLNKESIRATPVLEDAPIHIPQSATKAQGKAALVLEGYYQQALDFIDSLEEPRKTLANIAFHDTNEWQRDSEFLSEFAEYISIDDEELDRLFILAENIKL